MKKDMFKNHTNIMIEMIYKNQEIIGEGRDRMMKLTFIGLKYNIEYSVITEKVRHRLGEPTTLDTLIELYEEIPEFINKIKNKEK